MTTKRSKPYPSEFKASSVKLAVESSVPIAQTAKNLGININTLHNWIAKYSPQKESSMQQKEHHFDEIKRLKKELARVTQERDLLKKAAAYFARESQ
jgi:transposase